jgi:target of EGR1 protein 1
MEVRYAELCNVARSHAVVSLGMSVFTQSGQSYAVDNFQFLLICTTPHSVDPKSLVFLANSGFNLNDQILNGIPYAPGDSAANSLNESLRDIFISILKRKCPIIIHNGIFDLLFLYQSFYANLPSTLSSFVADLSEMFAGGIYDTKYVADYVTREKKSFLSYLFTK